jgi:DNA-binding IclR family transcriptional regulator
MRTAGWSESVSVLDRITAILDAFDDEDGGIGVTELARRANLPKSTVSRIAAELVEQRFLERDGDKLYLGVRLYEFGQNVDGPRQLRRLALPVMAALRDLTGHTVRLAIVSRSDVVHLAVVRGRAGEVSLGGTGKRLPAEGSALGRAVLAYTPPSAPAHVPPVTVVTDERGTGLTHLAAPVVRRGVPIAALSVCAPDADAPVDALAPVLRRAALALSQRVGVPRAR